MKISALGKKVIASLQAMAFVGTMGVFSMGTVAVLAPVGVAQAAECSVEELTIEAGAKCSQGKSAKENLFGEGGIFQTVANTLIFLVGAVAVIMLIIGGLRYVISSGDAKNVEAAKNTILYAIVGIVVAVISYALVQFVVTALNTGSGGGAV